MSGDSVPVEDLLRRAHVWHESGEADAAQILTQRALALAPGHSGAMALLARLRSVHTPVPQGSPTPQALVAAEHNNRGVAAASRGEAELALSCYAAALAVDPDHIEAWSNRGNSLQLLGRLEEAMACYDRAIAISPDYGNAYANRGHANESQARLQEALADYDRAIALLPNLVGVMVNRGNVLMQLKQFDRALASFDQAFAREPGLVEAINGRGAALADLNRSEEALDAFGQVLALAPGHVAAIVNSGAALHRLERFDEALEMQRRALVLKPDEAVAQYNFATTAMELRKFPEALEHFAAAQSLRADYIEAHWNESLCRLTTGDFARGWAKYEWGWRANQRGGMRDYGDQPRQGVDPWLGETPIDGLTMLLHGEQGLGDTLQFCRYAKLVRARGARVILEVQPLLLKLMQRLPDADVVVAMGDELPVFDRRMPLMSGPLAFGTTLQTVPSEVPYLPGDPAGIAAWRLRLAAYPGIKVGLVWSGDPRPDQPAAHSVDKRRSMRLAQMAPLAEVIGVTYVSLQKGSPAEQALDPPAGFALLDWTDELADFTDTADLVGALDLVITVDTSVAHLAGALARPVWVLSRYDGCWRWLEHGGDSPWYPTLRVIRQTARGDWAGVMGRVVAALRAMAAL